MSKLILELVKNTLMFIHYNLTEREYWCFGMTPYWIDLWPVSGIQRDFQIREFRCQS